MVTTVKALVSNGMPPRRWLPREGFTADVVQTVIQNTLLNPFLTLPLWLLARYHDRARGLGLDHPLALKRLTLCMYLGVLRWVNGFLSQKALNNWTKAKFDWKKELVLITGGADGFGKLWTLMFAEKGVKVVILDIQQPTFEIPKNVHYYNVDLTDPPAIKSVCDQVKSEIGHPTIVLNNAGIANHHTILDLEDSRLSRVVAVNQLAHYRIMRELLPSIVANNHGCIVTVASLAGFLTPAGLTDYCGSKAAAVAFHEGLSAELPHRFNAPAVRTILVAPNFAATKLAEGFVNKSTFISPTLHPATVAEAVFDKILSGNSGTVVLPKTHSWLGMTARAWPYWMQKGMATGLAEVMRPYNQMPHRDKVDSELLRMWVEGKIKVEDFDGEEHRKWMAGDMGVEEVKEWIRNKRG
ncbi:MAG: hypothetical protein LQ340_003582 [Diploschistes diacapsis]|nr:MAG: hypothetical protein LQ340_003582 [Diploschistes diacapsis]